jgi:hypothetical protein
MLHATMPWPMTLTPMNEAIELENHAAKKLIIGKITFMIREVMQDVRILLLSKKRKVFMRVGEERNRIYRPDIIFPNL